MIGPVHIRNYKSIRELKFEAKRVNLFIGEPNTGKSNIIEALSFFAQGTLNNFNQIFRFKSVADLFFDQKVANELNVVAGDWEFSLKFNGTNFVGHFLQSVNPATKIPKAAVQMHHGGLMSYSQPDASIRFYRFAPLEVFPNSQPGTLNPPFGDNLVAVLYSNEGLLQRIRSVIRSKGFRLQLKPTENEMLIAKDVNDELYSYPWKSVSETIRRVVFFMAVLETNQNMTLLFDEPEANTFPFYTAYLAERIALDETNQFFLTTHNPYILGSIVGKTPAKDLAVFVTSLENFSTRLKQVSVDGLSKILDYGPDAFLNLDKLVEA